MPTPPLPDSVLLEAVEALSKHGFIAVAARALGVPRNTLQHRLKIAKQRGIGTINEQLSTLHGHNPAYGMTHTVPAPLIVRGTSTLYKDGEQKLQWVKTRLDDRLVDEAIKAAISALSNDIPRAKPTLPPSYHLSNLCNVYTLTDAHVGAYCWKMENGGDDWDLNIAEDTIVKAFDYLIEAAPLSSTCVVAQLGDWMHYDSLEALTPTGKNLLDADSRFSKMVKVAIRILRYIVSKSLEKHEKVIVLMAEGNHDLASSVWLRHLFSILYENEPRVQVIDSEMPYYVYQHGKAMLAWHHGHMKKNAELPMLFAAQFPSMWGETTKRYCHTGHRHHWEEKEHSGMKVTQHSTLAARDAYASRHGWMSEREIKSVTYHSEFGQVATNTVTPEMLEGEKQ